MSHGQRHPTDSVRSFRQRVGRNLRLLRLAHGYSQQGVATKLAVSVGSISHWENGIRPLSIDYLYRLARLYAVAPEALLEQPISKPAHLGERLPANIRQKIDELFERTNE